MQIWAESGKSALPICNYSQILYQFLTFTQNLKRSQLFLLLREGFQFFKMWSFQFHDCVCPPCILCLCCNCSISSSVMPKTTVTDSLALKLSSSSSTLICTVTL